MKQIDKNALVDWEKYKEDVYRSTPVDQSMSHAEREKHRLYLEAHSVRSDLQSDRIEYQHFNCEIAVIREGGLLRKLYSVFLYPFGRSFYTPSTTAGS